LSDIFTLHQSYLEWLKYKTAKPLPYTVYRTRPKTVRKEMIGKRDEFLGGSKRNRQRWRLELSGPGSGMVYAGSAAEKFGLVFYLTHKIFVYCS